VGLGRGGQGRERSKSSLSRSARGEAAPLTDGLLQRSESQPWARGRHQLLANDRPAVCPVLGRLAESQGGEKRTALVTRNPILDYLNVVFVL
jgi:hypothetical protein